MQFCMHCGIDTRRGGLLCDRCSKPPSVVATERIDMDSGRTHRAETGLSVPLGATHFARQALLVLQIQHSQTPLLLRPADLTMIGRVDGTNLHQPEIDLTPYQALEKGVSRYHALLARYTTTLTITDMLSRNGTYINRERIRPKREYTLREGDEIRFGELITYVHFVKQEGLAPFTPLLLREEVEKTL
jgi:hypothetical protein